MNTKKYPAGLFVASGIELNERLAFYAVFGGAFTLFLNEAYGMSKGMSSLANNLLYAVLYLLPLLTARIGDSKFGYTRATILGAFIAGLGYLGLCIHQPWVTVLSCLALAIGAATFKPAVSGLVDGLYQKGDPNQTSAFWVFYVAINVGGLLAAFLADWSKDAIGVNGPFIGAAVAIAIGLTFFQITQKKIVTVQSDPTDIQGGVSPKIQKARDRAILYTAIVGGFFFLAFHQNSTTQTFWVRDSTDRTFGGFFAHPIGVLLYGGINSFFILFFTPFMIPILNWMERIGYGISTPRRIVAGMMIVSLGNLIFVVGGLNGADNGQLVSSWYFIGAQVFITIGELFLSPMGLSLVTQLAAPGKAGKALAIWFAGTGMGNLASGLLGPLWDKMPHSRFFLLIAGLTTFAGLAMLLKVREMEECLPKKVENTAQDTTLPPNIQACPTVGLVESDRAA